MAILEQLFKRNFDLTHRIFRGSLDKLLNSEFLPSTNPHIYDNILSCMSLLPRIYNSVKASRPDEAIE